MDLELSAKEYSEKEHTIDQRVAYLGFLAGANYIQNTQWISCKDKMPEKNQRVLVFNPNPKNENTHSIDVAIYIILVKDGGSFFYNNCHFKPIQDIKKWMPLPKAPSGEGWDFF